MRDYEEKSYYEIQLDNKQLILVFLAAVTVCVLIFVLGVMIGKGQKEAEFAAASREEKKLAASEPDIDQPQQPLTNVTEANEEQQAPKEPVSQEPEPEKEQTPVQAREQKPAPVPEKRSEQKYAFEDLDKTEPKPVAEKSKEKEEPRVETAATDVEQEEPQPSGRSRYTVQVMATSSRPKAEEQISRLRSRGYEPFMDESKNGDISVFKVRVGRFSDAQEAKAMASKIKSDLRLESWVAPLD